METRGCTQPLVYLRIYLRTFTFALDLSTVTFLTNYTAKNIKYFFVFLLGIWILMCSQSQEPALQEIEDSLASHQTGKN